MLILNIKDILYDQFKYYLFFLQSYYYLYVNYIFKIRVFEIFRMILTPNIKEGGELFMLKNNVQL